MSAAIEDIRRKTVRAEFPGDQASDRAAFEPICRGNGRTARGPPEEVILLIEDWHAAPTAASAMAAAWEPMLSGESGMPQP